MDFSKFILVDVSPLEKLYFCLNFLNKKNCNQRKKSQKIQNNLQHYFAQNFILLFKKIISNIFVY